MSYHYLFKYIIIGDTGNNYIYDHSITGVGKSCLLL